MRPTVSDDVQNALRGAFARAPTTLSVHPTPEQAAHTKQFALSVESYRNLDRYLHLGEGFPSNASEFEGRFPRRQLSNLEALDGNIYGDLMKAFTDVNQHCRHFHSNGFDRFIPVSQSIIRFCDFFAQRVEGDGCLKHKMAVLADENVPLTDQRCQVALDVALYIIGQLSEESKAVKEECLSLLNQLTNFLEVTKVDKKQMDEVNAKIIGPRHDGSEPYRRKLEWEVQSARERAEEGVRTAQMLVHAYEEDERKARDNPIASFFGMIGSVTGIDVLGFERARNTVNEYRKQAYELEQQYEGLCRSFEAVSRLSGSVGDIEGSIGHALDAIQNFAKTFGKLQEDFKTIGERLTSVGDVLDADDAFIRAFAETDLSDACASWLDVKTLAVEFVSFKH